MASTGFAGFALGFDCDLAVVPPPPRQPSLDLNISAAIPPTSGTNLGSEVVPLIWNGTVNPLLHPAPATFPRISPRLSAEAPPELALADLESVAIILKSRLFLES